MIKSIRNINVIIAELRTLYIDETSNAAGRLAEDDVERWSQTLGLSRSDLYDRVALYLAQGFQSSELSFQFCDAVIYDLHSIITFADEARPTLFCEIFVAFDEGEYRHRNDELGTDPVEKYTLPMLAQITSRNAEI